MTLTELEKHGTAGTLVTWAEYAALCTQASSVCASSNFGSVPLSREQTVWNAMERSVKDPAERVRVFASNPGKLFIVP
jgi:hypothetical protein